MLQREGIEGLRRLLLEPSSTATVATHSPAVEYLVIEAPGVVDIRRLGHVAKRASR